MKIVATWKIFATRKPYLLIAAISGFISFGLTLPTSAVTVAERATLDYEVPSPGTRLLADTRIEGARLTAPGTFQVDIVPITSSRGTPTVTRASSEWLVSRVSAAYEAMSGGTIKLELRTVHEPKQPQSEIRSSFSIDTLFTPALKADPGYAGLVLVGVVVPDPTLGFAGIATLGGSNILVNMQWREGSDVALTLAHEFGHNLGLGHSGEADCTRTGEMSSCSLSEYGDYSDFMGRFFLAYATNPPHMRLSLWHLKRLGLVPTQDVATVSRSGEYLLAPAYGGTGTRLLIIPAYGAAAYAIEYRPATGADSLLAQTQIYPVGASNSYYPNTPSHGVQVRIVTRNTDATRKLLPISTYGPNVSVITPRRGGNQGLLAGEQLLLPDGSTIRVLSLDPSRGAQISINMPTDTSPPSLAGEIVNWEFIDNSGIATIYNKDWRAITFRMTGEITDDRDIASAVMQVDGSEVARLDRPTFGDSMNYTPQRAGTFKVKITVSDISGNQSSAERTLTSALYQHDPSYVYLRRGSPATTTMLLYYPSTKGWNFTISELSAGRISSTRTSGAWRIATIRGLKPGQLVSLRILGADKYGQTDGGQVVSLRTPRR